MASEAVKDHTPATAQPSTSADNGRVEAVNNDEHEDVSSSAKAGEEDGESDDDDYNSQEDSVRTS